MSSQKTSTTISPNQTARIKSRMAFIEASEVLQETMVAAVKGEKYKLVDKAILHLNRAQKYHFNKIALGLAGFLQSFFLNEMHDKKRGVKYQKIRKKYQHLAHIEDQVDTVYLELSYKFNSVRTPSQKLIIEFDEACKNFIDYLDLESAPINTRVYALLITQAFMKHDYQRIEHLCKKIISWLASREFGYFSSFYNHLVPALIVQGKYPEGKKAIQQALANVNKNSNNWSIFTYYFHFILEIHNRDYQAAYTIFQSANQRDTINRFLKEQWLIVRGYIKFLQRQNYIEGYDQFKLDKLLKDLPLSTTDKQGNNINIIILSIILNLKRNRGQIIDRIEAIKKYVQRYLKGNLRARLFIRMLLTLPKYNFSPQVIQFRNEGNWKLLQKNNIQVVGMSEVEIIPYEDLWPMVLKALD